MQKDNMSNFLKKLEEIQNILDNIITQNDSFLKKLEEIQTENLEQKTEICEEQQTEILEEQETKICEEINQMCDSIIQIYKNKENRRLYGYYSF